MLEHAILWFKQMEIICRSVCRSWLGVKGDRKRKAGHPSGCSQQGPGNTDLKCGCQMEEGETLRSKSDITEEMLKDFGSVRADLLCRDPQGCQALLVAVHE